MNNEKLVAALADADWSGCAVGNKTLIAAAIDALTPAAQRAGQEAVAHIATRKMDGERFLVWPNNVASYKKYTDDFDVVDLYAAPVNGDEREKVARDAAVCGVGFLMVTPDGEKRLSPDEVYLRNAAPVNGGERASPAKVGGQLVEGLGRMTAEGEGIVTLQFVSEGAAQAFMCNFSPSVDVDAMPDIPAKVGGDEREAFAKIYGASKPEVGQPGWSEWLVYREIWCRALEYARAALSADGGEDKA